VWKTLNIVVQILNVFLVFVTQRLLKSDIKVKRKLVIFIGFVKNVKFLLVTSVCLVIILHDRSERTISKRESDYTNQHQETTEDSFKVICSWDVSISYCCNCRNNPVEWYSINTWVVCPVVRKIMQPCSYERSIRII